MGECGFKAHTVMIMGKIEPGRSRMFMERSGQIKLEFIV